MSNTTNRYFLGVVKLNLPFRVEQVELAPLVFVPAFIVTLYILAGIAALIHGPAEPAPQEVAESVEEDIQEKPSGIKVSNLVNDVSVEGGEIDLAGADTERMIPKLTEYYNKNHDCIGWLKIDDTVIDYPVLQNKEDNGYYVYRDFNKKEDDTGCIVMDADAEFGTGTKANNYEDGSKPSTNMIIGGHNMRNGSMFGNLDLFRKQSYTQQHNIIKFSTLYEEREYEIIAVFLSQIYMPDQKNVFRYYTFYEANSKEEFDDFIKNIKKLQMFDTGVTAEYGDELITLNTCTYHVADGRLVVVGKRIK